MGYIITLLGVFLFSFKDAVSGFEEGYTEGGKGGLFGLFAGAFILLITFFGLRILIYLYRFIDSVQAGDVFSDENADRLRRMGCYCTTIPFALFIFNALVYSNQRESHKNVTLSIIENVDFQIWLLIFGLTLLTIAFVFKKGIELTKENDLTI